MIRNVTGKLLISGFAVALFAKAATSFPSGPVPRDPPLPTGSDLFVLVADEEESPIVDPGEIPSSALLGAGEAFPNCEVPERVLQSLHEERALLDAQKKALADRESEVALAREKLDIEKAALTELQASIQELLGKIEAQQTEDLDRLIALYQNMKPAEAAMIMNDLDIEVMIMVLGKMSPRVAAPILARMSPVRARAVSKIILERSKLPGDQRLDGVRFN
ncbi:hypothetical protein [Aestuariivita sp.]|jgi:flagellar motility protein MotE (MotC chaperone)|uniref:MotE family protein n=1 Tax=Aestuariivita sp. TaxID=1872407 RepID=UPI0021724740|nr:hypothetical protein [Aestuariivita sp.]MCE8008975.1 hypothetical protein [Aestuariivita sp.]